MNAVIGIRCVSDMMESRSDTKEGGELLYNGIRFPAEWPPRDMDPALRRPMPVPYLESPPAVIPIDVGRQLFVDSFLIEHSDLRRVFHPADKFEGNPVLKPETPSETERVSATACPFDDGVAYDPETGRFLLWYLACYPGSTALAVSDDGTNWVRPDFGILPGTNLIIPHELPRRHRDSFCPFRDPWAEDPAERFKAYLFNRDETFDASGKRIKLVRENWLMTSPDGIHWNRLGQVPIHGDDGTNLHYNPFRNKWVLNMKTGYRKRRVRSYIECDRFRDFLELRPENPDAGDNLLPDVVPPMKTWPRERVMWVGADELDEPEPDWVVQEPTQLYMLEVVPYESLMLGVFAIHYGPRNDICAKGKYPKLTQLKVGYSRDGFHWSRTDRIPFIGATLRDGDWDRAYLRPAAGCLIIGERLHFYYCGFSGVHPDGRRNKYAGGSTHVATMRRDGFVSMDADANGGELLTRTVCFRGEHLFVNLDAPEGELRVEVIDDSGKAFPGFSLAECVPVVGDHTRVAVRWSDRRTLAVFRNRPVRFRFVLKRGSIYAFWVTPDADGRSHGYVASGGPDYSGGRDE